MGQTANPWILSDSSASFLDYYFRHLSQVSARVPQLASDLEAN
jgi:hypothetical protein